MHHVISYEESRDFPINIACTKQNALQMFFHVDFCSLFEATGPNCLFSLQFAVINLHEKSVAIHQQLTVSYIG